MFIIQHLDKLKRKEKLQMTTLTSLIVGILAVNLFESTSYIYSKFYFYDILDILRLLSVNFG